MHVLYKMLYASTAGVLLLKTRTSTTVPVGFAPRGHYFAVYSDHSVLVLGWYWRGFINKGQQKIHRDSRPKSAKSRLKAARMFPHVLVPGTDVNYKKGKQQIHRAQ